MTPDDLKKEAERIDKLYFDGLIKLWDDKMERIATILRAVHEAGYAEGFRHAREKAAERADIRKFYDPEGVLARDIRALQPEDDE